MNSVEEKEKNSELDFSFFNRGGKKEFDRINNDSRYSNSEKSNKKKNSIIMILRRHLIGFAVF